MSDEDVHKKLDKVLELLHGNSDPSKGIIVRLDRTEVLAQRNADSVKAMADGVTEFRQSVETWRTCVEDDYKNEIAHEVTPVKEEVGKLRVDSKIAKRWIRAGVWLVAPIYAGVVGLLFLVVKELIEKLSTL